jgi:hypothetical protein
MGEQSVVSGDHARSNAPFARCQLLEMWRAERHRENVTFRAHKRLRESSMDPAKVAQMVEVLNGLTARDALRLLVDCILTALDEAPPENWGVLQLSVRAKKSALED